MCLAKSACGPPSILLFLFSFIIIFLMLEVLSMYIVSIFYFLIEECIFDGIFV